jgi:hypothetical protein
MFETDAEQHYCVTDDTKRLRSYDSLAHKDRHFSATVSKTCPEVSATTNGTRCAIKPEIKWTSRLRRSSLETATAHLPCRRARRQVAGGARSRRSVNSATISRLSTVANQAMAAREGAMQSFVSPADPRRGVPGSPLRLAAEIHTLLRTHQRRIAEPHVHTTEFFRNPNHSPLKAAAFSASRPRKQISSLGHVRRSPLPYISGGCGKRRGNEIRLIS